MPPIAFLEKIIFFPFLAGTIESPLDELVQVSSIKHETVFLRLLKVQERVKILDDLILNWKNENKVWRCLVLVGGSPRGLETLVNYAKSLVQLENFQTNIFFERLKNNVGRSSLTENAFLKVLAFHTNGSLVSKNEKPSTDSGFTYEELQSRGSIFLEKSEEDKFQVRIPFLILKESVNLFQPLKIILEVFSPDLEGQDFEKMYPHFLKLRLSLLKKEKTDIYLQDIFLGASLKDEKVEYDDFDVKHVDEISKLPNDLKGGEIYSFNKNHPGCDSLITLKIEGKIKYFLLQTKRIKNSASEKMKGSFNACLNIIDQVKHVKENFAFVAVTTGTLGHGEIVQKLKNNNSIIIEKSRNKEHFQGFYDALCHERDFESYKAN